MRTIGSLVSHHRTFVCPRNVHNMRDTSEPREATCSDITNDQLGISGETDAVAQISMFIVCTVLPPVKWWFKFTAGVSHHTPPPPGGGAGLSQLIIF